MKIPEFLKTPEFIVTALTVLFFAMLMTAVGLQSNCSEKKVDRAVTTQTSEAQTQSNIAAESSINANVAAEARQTEDIIREKVIRPKLDNVRRSSEKTKAELKKAEKEFNDAKNNLHNLNASRALNCQRLRELFPNEIFEYCAGQR